MFTEEILEETLRTQIPKWEKSDLNFIIFYCFKVCISFLNKNIYKWDKMKYLSSEIR